MLMMVQVQSGTFGLLALFLICLEGPSWAENERICRKIDDALIENSASPRDREQISECLGYIDGYVGRSLLNQQTPSNIPRGPCIPDGITVERARQAFLGYLEKNEDVYALPAYASMDLALSAAFPCERK